MNVSSFRKITAVAFGIYIVLLIVLIEQHSVIKLIQANNESLSNHLIRNEKNTAHVIAHRGASGEEPEHSFAAYDLAIEYGAIYIEQDLGFSKEGTLFVSHDLVSEKWTGEERKLSDFSDAELTSFGVLPLERVIERYKESNIVFVIEVRDINRDNYYGRTQVEALIDMVSNYNLNGSIIIQAWETESLKRIKEYDESIQTMLLSPNQEGIQLGIESEYVDIICSDKNLMSESNSELVHASKKKYCVYTVNSVEEIQRTIANDVDMYFTDYVAKALLLEAKYRN